MIRVAQFTTTHVTFVGKRDEWESIADTVKSNPTRLRIESAMRRGDTGSLTVRFPIDAYMSLRDVPGMFS